MGMGFYEKVLSYLSIGNVVKDLNTGKGRADLINFLTDGTLPELNSKPSLKERENNLKVIYSGYQDLKFEY